MNDEWPRRRIKSPGGNTGQETLNNLNREEAGKSLKQKKRKGKKASPFNFALRLPGLGWPRWARLAPRCGSCHPPRPLPPAALLKKRALELAGPERWPRGRVKADPAPRPPGSILRSVPRGGRLRPRKADPKPAVSFGLSWPQPTQQDGGSRPSVRCRHRQSPGPSTPQHRPANFYYALRYRPHLGFLGEAFPDLPRTVFPQHQVTGGDLPQPPPHSKRKQLPEKATSFLITFGCPALIPMSSTKWELQSTSRANLKIQQ